MNKSLILTRVAATVVISVVTGLLIAVCFIPERTIYISGGASVAPVYRGSEEKPNVALMFNVYENTDVVNKIMDKLLDNGVIATFFVGGCWADDNAETLKRMADSGFEIGNHGYFHQNHKKLDFDANYQEISKCHSVVKALAGVDMTLFAPPSGAFNENTLKAADKLGYKSIMWTFDTIDWRDTDRDVIIKRATANVGRGALILMHPKQHTLDCLDEVIAVLKQKGLTPTTVSNCIL